MPVLRATEGKIPPRLQVEIASQLLHSVQDMARNDRLTFSHNERRDCDMRGSERDVFLLLGFFRWFH